MKTTFRRATTKTGANRARLSFFSFVVIAVLALGGGTAAAQSPVYGFAKQLNLGDAYHTSVTDASGNIYIAGGFQGTLDFDPGSGTANLTAALNGAAWDIFLAKYNSSGNYVWAFRVGRAGSNGDAASSIVLDADGNVVIAGAFDGSKTGVDFNPGSGTSTIKGRTFVAKYSTSGTYIWAFGLNLDLPMSNGSCIVDGSGNIYITGELDGTCDFDPSKSTANLTGNTDAVGSGETFVAKYSSSGSYVWAKKFIGVSAYARYNQMVLDASDNFYMTGQFPGTIDFDPSSGTANLTSQGNVDMYLAKYSSSGAYQWAFRVGAGGNDGGSSLILDGSGNIWVTGGFAGTADFDPSSGTANLSTVGTGNIGMFLAKYSSSGAYVSAFQVGGTSTLGVASGRRVALDGSGNIYVGGTFRGTVDFDPGSGTANLIANQATGDTIQRNDFFIAKYSSSGSYLWAIGIGGTESDGLSNLRLVGTDIVVSGHFRLTCDFDPGSGVANLTAVSVNGYSHSVYIAKYSQSGLAKESARKENPVAGELELTAAPNPFTDEFRFRCDGASGGQVEVLDLMGRTVESAEIRSAGEELTLGRNLPAGTYFLRFTEGSASQQMMVQKVR